MKNLSKEDTMKIDSQVKLDDVTLPVEVGEGEFIDITVHKHISVTDFVNGVLGAIDTIVGGNYHSYLETVTTNIKLLVLYTNLNMDIGNDAVVALAMNDEFMTRIESAIGMEALVFEDAIRDGVKFEKERLLKDSAADEVFMALASLANKLEEVASKVGDVDTNVLVDLAQSINTKSEKEIAHAVLDFQAAKEQAEANNE